MGVNRRSRIYYVDPSEKERLSIAAVLSSHCECIMFHDLSLCLRRLQNGDCELLLIDISLLDNDDPSFVKSLREMHPNLPIIAIGHSTDMHKVVRLVKNGVDDVLIKPIDHNTLINRAIRALNPCNDSPLTPCEKEIIGLILQRKSNKEIAWQLSRSVRTIEDHRANLMKKIGVSNRVDLVKFALRRNAV